jgi:hypothetical protein
VKATLRLLNASQAVTAAQDPLPLRDHAIGLVPFHRAAQQVPPALGIIEAKRVAAGIAQNGFADVE